VGNGVNVPQKVVRKTLLPAQCRRVTEKPLQAVMMKEDDSDELSND
jgi:hypothetical protein